MPVNSTEIVSTEVVERVAWRKVFALLRANEPGTLIGFVIPKDTPPRNACSNFYDAARRRGMKVAADIDYKCRVIVTTRLY
jgi:DNA-binding helix-hairpin-helix protein with protein kinase domain